MVVPRLFIYKEIETVIAKKKFRVSFEVPFPCLFVGEITVSNVNWMLLQNTRVDSGHCTVSERKHVLSEQKDFDKKLRLRCISIRDRKQTKIGLISWHHSTSKKFAQQAEQSYLIVWKKKGFYLRNCKEILTFNITTQLCYDLVMANVTLATFWKGHLSNFQMFSTKRCWLYLYSKCWLEIACPHSAQVVIILWAVFSSGSTTNKQTNSRYYSPSNY